MMELEMGIPDPDSYNTYYINKYARPNLLSSTQREYFPRNVNTIYEIPEPKIRNGVNGWKLTRQAQFNLQRRMQRQ